MFAPGPKLAACLAALNHATLEARLLGWKGEQGGLTVEESERLANLMDAVHNLPGLAASWERCNEELLRQMLGDYDARYGGGLLDAYDRAAATFPHQILFAKGSTDSSY